MQVAISENSFFVFIFLILFSFLRRKKVIGIYLDLWYNEYTCKNEVFV